MCGCVRRPASTPSAGWLALTVAGAPICRHVYILHTCTPLSIGISMLCTERFCARPQKNGGVAVTHGHVPAGDRIPPRTAALTPTSLVQQGEKLTRPSLQPHPMRRPVVFPVIAAPVPYASYSGRSVRFVDALRFDSSRIGASCCGVSGLSPHQPASGGILLFLPRAMRIAQ